MTRKSRVQGAKLRDQFYSLLCDFGRKPLTANVSIGGSDFNHDLTLAFFDDKVRQQERAKKVQHGTLGSPVKYRPIMRLRRSPPVTRFSFSPKGFFQPFDDAFIATGKDQSSVKLPSVSIFSLLNLSAIKTSFAINEPRHIGDSGCRLIGAKLGKFGHLDPFVVKGTMLNEPEISVQLERLNEETP